VLKGNAAVTLLQGFFACDITIAQARCEACGSAKGVGSLRPYAAPMGSAAEEPIVLVIDDDPLMLGGLSSLVRSIGLRVETFASATETQVQ
jgi:Family of unknown function (DUF6510)